MPCRHGGGTLGDEALTGDSMVVGFVFNGVGIADPADVGVLDIVGFDTAASALIADFIRAA